MVKIFRMGLSLRLVPPAPISPSPPAWPNPEARHHCSISVTFDGPGLKQIYIPLVYFKRCLNNDASQRQVNEACSGLAASDFKINLIRAEILSVHLPTPPPFFAPSYSLFVSVSLHHLTTPLFTSFHLSIFQVSSFVALSPNSSPFSLPLSPAPLCFCSLVSEA